MHTVIDGVSVYVVEFETMPELPIQGFTNTEGMYGFLTLTHPEAMGFLPGRTARVLTDAIEKGIITEPGKYGIHLVPGTDDYKIYVIQEP